MHVSGEHYNVGHPQKYVGGLLHNAYEAGEESHSLKAKLPPAFVDSAVYLFLVDSCVRLYRDWTTDHEDRPAPEEHFVWLSEEIMPFCIDPGQPHVPPDFTLDLAEVRHWLAQDGEPPWILDPKECPKPVHPDPGSASLGAENGSWKRKNQKKHHHRLRSELKVTNRGEGKDSPVWSQGGQGGPSSSSESSAASVDSGFSSTQKWQGVNTTGATMVQGDRTHLLSPATIQKLDAGDYDDKDDPLSDCPDFKPSDDNQEMAIVEERPMMIVGDIETGPKEAGMGKKDMGRNLGGLVDAQDPVLPSTSSPQPGPTRPSTGTLASAEAVEMRRQKSHGGPILSLADHEEPVSSLTARLLRTGCPNLPAFHPGSLLLHPSSVRTRKRLEDPVPVLPTLRTMIRCPTRKRVQKPKAVSGIIPLPLGW